MQARAFTERLRLQVLWPTRGFGGVVGPRCRFLRRPLSAPALRRTIGARHWGQKLRAPHAPANSVRLLHTFAQFLTSGTGRGCGPLLTLLRKSHIQSLRFRHGVLFGHQTRKTSGTAPGTGHFHFGHHTRKTSGTGPGTAPLSSGTGLACVICTRELYHSHNFTSGTTLGKLRAHHTTVGVASGGVLRAPDFCTTGHHERTFRAPRGLNFGHHTGHGWLVFGHWTRGHDLYARVVPQPQFHFGHHARETSGTSHDSRSGHGGENFGHGTRNAVHRRPGTTRSVLPT